MIIFECSSVLANNKIIIKENASKKDWQKEIKKVCKDKDHCYLRFTLVSKRCVTVDYGSWSHFIGVEGTEEEIKNVFPEFFQD